MTVVGSVGILLAAIDAGKIDESAADEWLSTWIGEIGYYGEEVTMFHTEGYPSIGDWNDAERPVAVEYEPRAVGVTSDAIIAELKADDWLASAVDIDSIEDPKISVATGIELQYVMWDRIRARGIAAEFHSAHNEDKSANTHSTVF